MAGTRVHWRGCTVNLLIFVLLASQTLAYWTPPPLPSSAELGSARDAPSQRVAAWLLGMHSTADSPLAAIPPPVASNWTLTAARHDWNKWLRTYFASHNASADIMDTCSNAIVAAHAPWCAGTPISQQADRNTMGSVNVVWTENAESGPEGSGGRVKFPTAPSSVEMSMAFRSRLAHDKSMKVMVDVCLLLSPDTDLYFHSPAMDNIRFDVPYRLHIFQREMVPSHGSLKRVLRAHPNVTSFVAFSLPEVSSSGELPCSSLDADLRIAARLCHHVVSSDDAGDKAAAVMMLHGSATHRHPSRRMVVSREEGAAGHVELRFLPSSSGASSDRVSFTITADLEGTSMGTAPFAVPDRLVITESLIAFPARGSSPLTFSRIARGCVVGGLRGALLWLGALASQSPSALDSFPELLRQVRYGLGLTVAFYDLPSIACTADNRKGHELGNAEQAFVVRRPRCMAFATAPVVPHSDASSSLHLLQVRLAPAPMAACLGRVFLPSCYIPKRRTFQFLGTSNEVKETWKATAGENPMQFVGPVFFREGLCLYGGPKWTSRQTIYGWYAPQGLTKENWSSPPDADGEDGACNSLCKSRQRAADEFFDRLKRDDLVNPPEADEDVPRKTPNLPPVHVKRQIVNPRGKT